VLSRQVAHEPGRVRGNGAGAAGADPGGRPPGAPEPGRPGQPGDHGPDGQEHPGGHGAPAPAPGRISGVIQGSLISSRRARRLSMALEPERYELVPAGFLSPGDVVFIMGRRQEVWKEICQEKEMVPEWWRVPLRDLDG